MNYIYLLANTIELERPIPVTPDNLVQNTLGIVFGVLGGISVVVLIWAGMKYTMSSGDPSKTTEAKNQIMYAAIGLIVALSAEAIIKFALGRFI